LTPTDRPAAQVPRPRLRRVRHRGDEVRALRAREAAGARRTGRACWRTRAGNPALRPWRSWPTSAARRPFTSRCCSTAIAGRDG